MRQWDKSERQMDEGLMYLRVQEILDQTQGEAPISFLEINPRFSTAMFELLFKKHNRLLCSYVSRLLSSYDETDDIVQETWIALDKEIQQRSPSWLEQQTNLLPWLKRVAKNKAINYIKTRQRMISLDTKETISLSEPPIPPYDYPDNTVIRGEDSLTLYQAVKTLPRPQRDVIALRFFYAWSLDKIAQELQLPLSTVKALLYRGIKRLKKSLASSEVTRNDLVFWEHTQERFPKIILRKESPHQKDP